MPEDVSHRFLGLLNTAQLHLGIKKTSREAIQFGRVCGLHVTLTNAPSFVPLPPPATRFALPSSRAERAFSSNMRLQPIFFGPVPRSGSLSLVLGR